MASRLRARPRSVRLAPAGVVTLVCALAAFSSLPQTQAKAEDVWSVISIKEVPVADASVAIPLGEVPGRFRGFRVRSPDARYTITAAQVTYADGSKERSSRRIGLRPGQTSPTLFSTREGRFVDALELTFRVSRSGRGNRVVELSGLQTEEDRVARRDDPAGDGAATTPEKASDEGPAGESKTAEQTGIVPPTAAPDAIRDSGPPVPSRPVRSATSPAGDVLIGATRFDGTLARGAIAVPDRIGRFSKIRLRALDSAAFVRSVSLGYRDGRKRDLEIDTNLKPAEESSWLDIDADAFLESIEIETDPERSGTGRARLEVFGAHADGWLGPDGEGRKYNGGWVLLAAQTAGFLGFDTDDIVIGEKQGGFTELKVSVRERAITLGQIKVVYGDGGEDVIAVASKVEAGQSYGPVALKSGKKDIARIETRYRSWFIDGAADGNDSAIVEIWAKH